VKAIRWTSQAESDLTKTILFVEKEWGSKTASRLFSCIDTLCKTNVQGKVLFHRIHTKRIAPACTRHLFLESHPEWQHAGIRKTGEGVENPEMNQVTDFRLQ
jgi:plasmid stabilization system protein ParE